MIKKCETSEIIYLQFSLILTGEKLLYTSTLAFTRLVSSWCGRMSWTHCSVAHRISGRGRQRSSSGWWSPNWLVFPLPRAPESWIVRDHPPLSCKQGCDLHTCFGFSRDSRGESLLGWICYAVQSPLYVLYARDGSEAEHSSWAESDLVLEDDGHGTNFDQRHTPYLAR
jgi:hypothetical protein